jgi:hypothetical protein
MWEPRRLTTLRAFTASYRDIILPNSIRGIKARMIRWARHVAGIEETRSLYNILVGRPEGKKEIGIPRSESEDNRLYK